MSIVAITNPSDSYAKASVVEEINTDIWNPSTLLEKFADRVEDGALISVFDLNGVSPGVWQYIVERYGNTIVLRTNDTLSDYIDTADAGAEIETITVVPDEPAPAAETLKTFTVVGEDDEGDGFVAIVTASSPEEAKIAGINAGLVEDGYEHEVDVHAVFEGDLSDADVTKEAI